MSGAKLDVIWSPVHHDKFIIWGPDITLYEVSNIHEIEKKTTFVPISSTLGATVVASQSANGVRCVDICPIPESPDPLLALGYTNGRVALSNLKQCYDPLGLVGREFVPKYPRLCNSVSWSHVESNMLAVAMEKHRSDHCILLWDVNRGMSPGEAARDGASVMQTSTESARPLAEMGLSETAHSVSWSNCSNRTLIASMNLKFIKIFDLRDWSNKAVSTATSRYCYGACADPLNTWQLASHGDSVACVWDARQLTAPLLTLQHVRSIAALQWCPTRRNLLLTLQRDSNSIRLHDIQQAYNDTKNSSASSDIQLEACAIEADAAAEWVGTGGARALQRDVTPAPSVTSLAAFTCHPTDPRRLLAVTTTGGILDYTVCERVIVAWEGGCGGGGNLLWTGTWGGGGGGTGTGGYIKILSDEFKDISHTMKRRAQTDYGLKPDLWQNADLADDEELSNLWHFLALSKSLVEDGCIRGVGGKHPGVRGVLEGGGYRSEMVPSLLPDLPSRRVTVYKSVERQRALQLCGWGWGWENAGAGVERAEAEGTPCRAAALAAFHLRVRTALDVLARAHEPQLRVAALALAGLGEERLWREALAAAAPALPDPYLRALTYFLAATAPSHPVHSSPTAPTASTAPTVTTTQDYSAVLNETGMRLEDRVAFACMFLSDARLHDYLQRTGAELCAQGRLVGLLLTGVTTEGLTLVQRWLERSGDLQTAALLVARCCTGELLQDSRAQHWLDSYRMILDSWQLWWARCALDTWVSGGGAGAVGGAGGAARHVAVACTYCGKSVAAPPPRPGPRPNLARLPPPAAKMKQISSCPNCRKPLPRCAVCSLHLGTGGAVSAGGGGGGAGGAGAGGAGAGGAAFGGWFGWCVACRHGGHAAHLLQWFSEHTECPVSSCNCRCSTLDPPDRLP